MTDFKKKLSILLAETTDHMIFMDEPVYTDIDEDAIVSEISSAGPLYGLKYLGYVEGILSFSTYQKSSVTNFALFLDDNEFVDHYAISLIESTPLTHTANVVDEVDFDSMRESEFTEFFIDVAINWQYVNFNPVYVNPQDHSSGVQPAQFYVPQASGTTEYPYDRNDTEFYDKDNELPVDPSPGFDAISGNEVPLLVKLSTIKSAADDGHILVTVHPKNDNEVLVQAVYTHEPDQADVLRDLDVINNLDAVYGDKLELETEAIYKYGDKHTTAAVYTTINNSNVLNIVEVFAKDIVDAECDINLLVEITRKIKVNFRGKKRIKMQCQPGFKYDPDRMVCVKISGAELAVSRIAHRQMARTKRSLGASYRTRILRKVRRAKKFRKMMGIKND